jgi:peptidoglycan LD-endopeptidase CwlK
MLFSEFDDTFKSETPKCLVIRDSLHPELKAIIDQVSKYFDIALIGGYRGPESQEKFGRKKFPNSKHNTCPSEAVDLLPYPINRENLLQIAYLAGHIKMTAHLMGLKILWGSEKYMLSGRIKNYSYVHHFELVF